MMIETTEFKNANGDKYCTVIYDPGNQWVYDSWSGIFGSQENFRKGLMCVRDMMRQHHAPRGLSDTSNMVGSYDGSKAWVQAEIIPELVKAGLRHHAMVISQNIFSKLSTKDYVMTMKDYEVQLFDSLEKAKLWLLSK
jgi:hypothetical protein